MRNYTITFYRGIIFIFNCIMCIKHQ